VRPYFQGIADVFQGRPRGVYGGLNVTADLGGSGIVQYRWGTNANWYNFGVTDPLLNLKQHYQDSPIPAADRNTVLQDDWGGWDGSSQEEDFMYSQWPPLEKLAFLRDVMNLMVMHDSNGQEMLFH